MSGFVSVMRPLLPLLLATTLTGFAAGLLSVLIGVRVAASGVDGAAAGLLLSSYFAGLVLGCRAAPRLVGWIGPVGSFALCAAAMTALTVLFTRTGGWGAWLALRFLSGLILACTFTVTESSVNSALPAGYRARGFTAYLTLNNGASGLAPLVLTLADPLGPGLFMLAALAFALSPAGLFPARRDGAGPRQFRAMPVRELARISPIGVATCFTHGLTNTALLQVAPIYFEQAGLGYAALSVFIALATAARILVQTPAGAASDRFGRRPVLLGLAAGTALLPLPLALAGPAPEAALVFGLGLATMAACGPLYGLGNAAANDRLDPAQVLPASGGLVLVWAAGSMVGPVVATALMQHFGAGGLFLHLALAGAALCGVILWERK